MNYLINSSHTRTRERDLVYVYTHACSSECGRKTREPSQKPPNHRRKTGTACSLCQLVRLDISRVKSLRVLWIATGDPARDGSPSLAMHLKRVLHVRNKLEQSTDVQLCKKERLYCTAPIHSACHAVAIRAVKIPSVVVHEHCIMREESSIAACSTRTRNRSSIKVSSKQDDKAMVWHSVGDDDRGYEIEIARTRNTVAMVIVRDCRKDDSERKHGDAVCTPQR